MVMPNSKHVLGVAALVALSLTSVEAQEVYRQNTATYLREAIVELNKSAPDFHKAFDSLEAAVNELQAAISTGELEEGLGTRWMDRVTAIAGQIASDQLDDTTSQRGKQAKAKPKKKQANEPVDTTHAKEQLVAGDASRAAGQYWEAIEHYRNALPVGDVRVAIRR